MTRKQSKIRKSEVAHLFPKIGPELERLIPSCDSVWTVDSVYSCYIRAHGYFYLTKVGDTTEYLFMRQALNRHLKPQVYANGRLDGGKKLDRFLSRSSTSILIQFDSHDDLLLVTTNNQWLTVEIQTKPVSYLSTYLGINDLSSSSPSALKGLRDRGGKDVIYQCSDNKTAEAHTSILKTKWKAMEEILITTKHKPSDPEPLVLTTEYPSGWMEAMFAFLYGERNPMDWKTAMGIMVMARIFQLPELSSYAEAWIYNADDMSTFDAFHVWHQVHTFSEHVAVYCINQMKREGHICSRDVLVLFVSRLPSKEGQRFLRCFCPNVDASTVAS